MEYPSGEFFSHYTTREAAFQQILPSGRLRFSPYSKMRDPLENKPWSFAGAYAFGSHATAEDQQSAEEALGDFHRGASAIWDSAKLLALTVDAESGYEGDASCFGRGWSRARMWDQYGEKHAGVCLLFSRDKLIASIVKSLEHQGLPPPYHRKVDYTEEGPSGQLLDLDLNALKAPVDPQVVARYVEDHNDVMFFLKTSDWETEYEYRFVVTAPNDEYLYVEYGDALTAVFLGEQFPEWQMPGAVTASRQAGAETRQLDWSTRRPLPASLDAHRSAGC